MYDFDTKISPSAKAYIQCTAEDFTTSIFQIIKKMIEKEERRKLEEKEEKITLLQHIPVPPTSLLYQQQQQRHDNTIQGNPSINNTTENNNNYYNSMSSVILTSSNKDIILVECIVPFIQKIQSLLLRGQSRSESETVIRSTEASLPVTILSTRNTSTQGDLEAPHFMMMMKVEEEGKSIEEDNKLKDNINIKHLVRGNLIPSMPQYPIQYPSENFKSRIANYIIDKTFDEHKVLLRNKLRDALEELERYRSGTVMNELTLENKKLSEESQLLQKEIVRRDEMMETLIIERQEQLARVGETSLRMASMNVMMIHLLRTFAICEAWQEEQSMVVFYGLWEHCHTSLRVTFSSNIEKTTSSRTTTKNNNNKKKKFVPDSCRKSDSSSLPPIEMEDPHKNKEGPSSIFKAQLHYRRSQV